VVHELNRSREIEGSQKGAAGKEKLGKKGKE
jgi:hypothetical protein